MEPKTNKILRLITTYKCDRHCKECCNKQTYIPSKVKTLNSFEIIKCNIKQKYR